MTPNTPKLGNGLTLLIRVGKYIGLKWVNKFRLKRFVYLNKLLPITLFNNSAGLKIRVNIWKLFSSFFCQNICCEYSKELFQWGITKHIFKLMCKKIITFFAWKFAFLDMLFIQYFRSEVLDNLYEPVHDKTDQQIHIVPSNDLEQPALMPSLFWVFAGLGL